LEFVKKLKDKGIYVYAAGFGYVNKDFINQLASNAESSVYAPDATYLKSLLQTYAKSISKNASKAVAVNMGAKIDFMNVISNKGGEASVTGVNGTLYWDPKITSTSNYSEMVYRVKINQVIDTDFFPVSSAAVVNFCLSVTTSRSESFDIPNVRFKKAPASFIVTFLDYDDTKLDEQIVLSGKAATAPPNPIRVGHTFTGWSAGFSNITANLTVKAQYKVDEPPVIVFVTASAVAVATKLVGNKNELTITVIEAFSDGSENVIIETFIIDNNAANTYQVGKYRVYVDTKGNTQIRECYIVSDGTVTDDTVTDDSVTDGKTIDDKGKLPQKNPRDKKTTPGKTRVPVKTKK
jgi:hypothetical protein